MTTAVIRSFMNMSALGLVHGDPVVVFGLARSGIAAARLLRQLGAEVTVTDAKPESELPTADVAQLRELGIRLALGGHPAGLTDSARLVILSPGVPLAVPGVARAASQFIPVIGELEVAWRLSEAPFVAITGTNGKSTTTALTGALLAELDRPVIVAGNIGTALCGHASEMTPQAIVAAEVSSYQLESTTMFHPRISVWLNLTPDHLDRHGTMDRYAEAKALVFRRQTADEALVANADDAVVARYARQAPCRVWWISTKRQVSPGVYLADNQLVVDRGKGPEPLLPRTAIQMPGLHNVENTLAAAAAALLAGVDPARLARAAAEFPGLEHRIEWCGHVSGIDFYNDSKATNVDATIRAVLSFDRPIVLIAGGRDKGTDLLPLADAAAGKIRHAVLIGEAADRMAAAFHGQFAVSKEGSLAAAVRRARALAMPGDVVLLSPACASFDMFHDFEHRGDTFKQIVRGLPSCVLQRKIGGGAC